MSYYGTRSKKVSKKPDLQIFLNIQKNGLMVKMVTNQIPISCTVLVSFIFVAK